MTATWTSSQRAFDAGVQFGEYIQKDMVAVRVSKDIRAAIVGAPEYFKFHPNRKRRLTCELIDASTSDTDHPAAFYRWSSTRGRRSFGRFGEWPPDC